VLPSFVSNNIERKKGKTENSRSPPEGAGAPFIAPLRRGAPVPNEACIGIIKGSS